MKIYPLDFISFTLTDSIILGFLITILIAFVEWLVLLPFKINTPGKMFLYSLIVNIVSSAIGLAKQEWFQANLTNTLLRWFLAYCITVLIEGFLLVLLNKKREQRKIWMATVVMNLVTYIPLYLIAEG